MTCVAYKQQKLTAHSSEAEKSKIMVPTDSVPGEGQLPRQLSFHSYGRRGKGARSGLLYKSTNPCVGVLPFKSPPKGPTSLYHHFGTQISAYECGGGERKPSDCSRMDIWQPDIIPE